MRILALSGAGTNDEVRCRPAQKLATKERVSQVFLLILTLGPGISNADE